MEIKEKVTEEITSFIAKANTEIHSPGVWQEPLVGFADVQHSCIRELKRIANPNHQMPEEVLEDASIVIVYFTPFEAWLSRTNLEKGLASPEWAEYYEVTNALFARLNAHIVDFVHKLGYEAKLSEEAGVFDRTAITSRWSTRHFAYAAGLGTFGINNMLITDRGCCGRLNTIVTNLDVAPDAPRKEEACLYKRNGSCGVCVDKCPSGALTRDGYDRRQCFGQCLQNAAVYNGFGSSYASKAGGGAENSGSEVCGKCLAGVPCAHRRP